MSKFKVGDRVIVANPCKSSGHDVGEGFIGYVTEDNPPLPYRVESLDGMYLYWFQEKELELLERKEVEFSPVESEFDSSLQGRKKGKNQMELVETGFPNALLMLGEVMTWAAENKGYEPNDWKNLPTPKMSLLGAASRHRVKRLAGQDNDDESGLSHLSHEAFNVMAQLELLLMGKLN